MLTALRSLLSAAFDGTFSDDDLDHALGGLHVLATDGDELVAHAAVVPRELIVGTRTVRAGYVEAVATLPSRHGLGLGGDVMRLVNAGIVERYELGMLSTSRHSFYARLGWERWLGPSHVLDGTTWVRTPDEDDGLMALRPPGATFDLSAPVACHPRRGDHW